MRQGRRLPGLAGTADLLLLIRVSPHYSVDNRPEFISRELDKWAYLIVVELDFSRPGKPVDDACIASFSGSFRDERLNINWFLALEDAREKIDSWRRDHNEWRPHRSLDNLSPRQYLEAQTNTTPDSLLLAGPALG